MQTENLKLLLHYDFAAESTGTVLIKDCKPQGIRTTDLKIQLELLSLKFTPLTLTLLSLTMGIILN
jgi:hypothetical protein